MKSNGIGMASPSPINSSEAAMWYGFSRTPLHT
jgi:hypothetical protein